MNNLLCNKRSFEFLTNPGSSLKKLFHGKVMPSGQIELVFDGYENMQEYIDSFIDETDIVNIISRINSGEIDLINQKHGQYIDSIGLPKSYAEVLQQVIDGKKVFEALPAEIKEKFGNDFNQWFAQMDNEDWMEKSGFIQKKVDIVKGEVKEEE